MDASVRVHQFAGGEVQVWRDEGCVCIKTLNPHDDPVELSDEEALELAQLLRQLAE